MSTSIAASGAIALAPFAEEARRRRETPTAPVPANAKGPQVPASGYVLDEIADGIFWLSDGSYQSMFVVTADGVVAVDAPPTLGHNILRGIGRVTRKPGEPFHLIVKLRPGLWVSVW